MATFYDYKKNVLAAEGGGTSNRSIKILCFGNSFTQDCFMYAPFFLQNIAPNLDVTIGIAYKSGCKLSQHYDIFENNTAGYTFYKFTAGNNAWETLSIHTPSQIIKNDSWDIVTFQQASAEAHLSYDTYFAPYLPYLLDWIMDNTMKPVKFGWLLTHAKPTSSASAPLYGTDATYALIAANAQKVLEKNPVEFVIPYGTGVQNARHTDINNVVCGGLTLTYDNTHLQEGIPCMVSGYTSAISILNMASVTDRGILGETTLVNKAWLTEHQIKGMNPSNPTETQVVGVTKENARLAQECAIFANRYPFEIKIF